ncbi:hypothetical protein H920_01220 [Fukomys damarensis]|uniref:Uncharacterized protein n=1 Tax=Fukomys damarensis TaxID=885580 RepID=A0A091E202_FUKDA|nr:hypothetical protein H920_01220 [Fukomys damarensis]
MLTAAAGAACHTGTVLLSICHSPWMPVESTVVLGTLEMSRNLVQARWDFERTDNIPLRDANEYYDVCTSSFLLPDL